MSQMSKGERNDQNPTEAALNLAAVTGRAVNSLPRPYEKERADALVEAGSALCGALSVGALAQPAIDDLLTAWIDAVAAYGGK